MIVKTLKMIFVELSERCTKFIGHTVGQRLKQNLKILEISKTKTFKNIVFDYLKIFEKHYYEQISTTRF